MMVRVGSGSVSSAGPVAAAGVSQRTFFRCFESKEDVIVHVLAEAGAALGARSAAEPAAAVLRHTFAAFAYNFTEHPGKSPRIAQLVLPTPALLGRYLERQAQRQADIAAMLSRRTGQDPAGLRPAPAAGTALTAFHTALSRWVASDGTRELTHTRSHWSDRSSRA